MRYALRLAALTGSLSVAFILGPAASDSHAQRASRRAPRVSRPPVATPAPARYYYTPAPAPSAPASVAPAPARTQLMSATGASTFSYGSGSSSPAPSPPASGYYYVPAPVPPRAAPAQPPAGSRNPGGSRRAPHVTSEDDPYAYKS